jgi:plasmid replication initiation protein
VSNFTRSNEEAAADLRAAESRLANQKKYRLAVRTDKPLPERHINMANILSRAAQSLKLIEKRVVAVALAKTDSVPYRDLQLAEREGWTVRITAEEYAEQFSVTLNVAYEQLQEAKILMERQLRFFEKGRKGLKEVIINWCGMYQYHHGEGWVEFSFTPQIAPLLLALRGEKTPFTSYQLSRVAGLKSIHSWRLFECLLSWRAKGRWEPTIEEFCYTMDLPPSYQKDFGAIRRRVIDPAMAELTEKDNLIITLDLKKSGRKVTGLDFKFRENPQGRLL